MSVNPVSASNIVTPQREETRTRQVTSPALLVAGTAELRRDVGDLHGNVTDLHQSAQEAELSLLTEKLALEPAPNLLDRLADDFGMAWALVARVVGVTPAAVRKWRRGEKVTPVHHRHVAEFAAFCLTVRRRDPRIQDVGHWLESPVASRSEVTRVDLYLDGHRAELLNIAVGDTTGESVLDKSDPQWRDRAANARRWTLVHHEDGSTSVVGSSKTD